MTVRISDKPGVIRALELLAADIQAGVVVSCSIHYEPTSVARVSVCYVPDREHSELPGVKIDDDEDRTATTVPLGKMDPQEEPSA